MADKKLKITLVKSPIGAVPKHRKTVEAMGLNKVNKTVELPDNACHKRPDSADRLHAQSRRESNIIKEGGAVNGFIKP